MRQLLVINPNTSTHVSALLQQHVQAAVGPHVAVRTATARFGAPYIACEASYAVAAHAALDAWAHDLVSRHRSDIAGCAQPSERSARRSAQPSERSAQPIPGVLASDATPRCGSRASADRQMIGDATPAQPHPAPPPDAVLIGCFGDPGLMALRESSPVPVTGLAEASFMAAARHGRYAIVTGGARWGPMLQRLAQALGQAQALAGIHTVAATGAQLAADPVAAHTLLAQACRDAVRQMGVQAVILGGAGLAGMAAAVQSQLDVPVIDSVVAGAHWALHAPPATAAQRQTAGFAVAWAGLSPEMAVLGA